MTDLSAFSLAAFWKVANVEEVSRPAGLGFCPDCGVAMGLGPGVLVILLLRLPQPFSAPLVLGPYSHDC